MRCVGYFVLLCLNQAGLNQAGLVACIRPGQMLWRFSPFA